MPTLDKDTRRTPPEKPRAVHGPRRLCRCGCGRPLVNPLYNQKFYSPKHKDAYWRRIHEVVREADMKVATVEGGGTPPLRLAVLLALRDNYPRVKSTTIFHVSPGFVSGGRRLRDLHREGLIAYEYEKRTSTYHIKTPLKVLDRLIEEEARGGKA